jgi:hypothetical protein
VPFFLTLHRLFGDAFTIVAGNGDNSEKVTVSQQLLEDTSEASSDWLRQHLKPRELAIPKTRQSELRSYVEWLHIVGYIVYANEAAILPTVFEAWTFGTLFKVKGLTSLAVHYIERLQYVNSCSRKMFSNSP